MRARVFSLSPVHASCVRSGDAAVTLPLAIMTSGDTHAGTERLLAENDNFGMAGGQSATWPADRCTGGKLQAWFDALAPVPLIV